jgi:putative ABC transport system permease protein
MIIRDEITEILETLKRNKLRTIITTFGVFWGIFMLLLLLATGDGLEKGVTNMFRGYDTNSMHIYSFSTKIPYLGIKEGRKIDMSNDDFIQIQNKFRNNLKYLASRSETSDYKLVKNNKLSEKYRIYGVTPEMYNIRKIELKKGRYINNIDVKRNRATVLIGVDVHKELFKNNPLNKFIEIESTFYKVVGVFESLREGERADIENKMIMIPHSTFQNNFNKKNKIDNIAIVARNQKTEKKVMSFLRERHKVHPEDNAFKTWNTREEFSKYQGLFKGIRVFMWIIGIGTLMSGIVGVSNIMVINIKERTKEIGIRKALGAKPSSIIRIILLESIFLTGFSGYMGLSVGLFFIEFVNYSLRVFELKSDFFLNPEINLSIVIISLFSILISGAFASFFPAKKASTIKPIVALRED